MLLDELQHRQLLPALYFASLERSARSRSAAWAGASSTDANARGRRLVQEICDRFELDLRDPALQAILGRALVGVGYHHAGMLPIHKEVVERLFTSGLLKLLFTTDVRARHQHARARPSSTCCASMTASR